MRGGRRPATLAWSDRTTLRLGGGHGEGTSGLRADRGAGRGLGRGGRGLGAASGQRVRAGDGRRARPELGGVLPDAPEPHGRRQARAGAGAVPGKGRVCAHCRGPRRVRDGRGHGLDAAGARRARVCRAHRVRQRVELRGRGAHTRRRARRGRAGRGLPAGGEVWRGGRTRDGGRGRSHRAPLRLCGAGVAATARDSHLSAYASSVSGWSFVR